MKPELTEEEAKNVRAAARFFRARFGSMKPLLKMLRTNHNSIFNSIPSPLVAFRLARLAGVGVDDVLAGRFPVPGTCPHCGHVKEEAAPAR